MNSPFVSKEPQSEGSQRERRVQGAQMSHLSPCVWEGEAGCLSELTFVMNEIFSFRAVECY